MPSVCFGAFGLGCVLLLGAFFMKTEENENDSNRHTQTRTRQLISDDIRENPNETIPLEVIHN